MSRLIFLWYVFCGDTLTSCVANCRKLWLTPAMCRVHVRFHQPMWPFSSTDQNSGLKKAFRRVLGLDQSLQERTHLSLCHSWLSISIPPFPQSLTTPWRKHSWTCQGWMCRRTFPLRTAPEIAQSHTFKASEALQTSYDCFIFEFWQMCHMRIDKWCFTHGESMSHSDRIVANCRQGKAVDASSPYFSPEGEERERESAWSI